MQLTKEQYRRLLDAVAYAEDDNQESLEGLLAAVCGEGSRAHAERYAFACGAAPSVMAAMMDEFAVPAVNPIAVKDAYTAAHANHDGGEWADPAFGDFASVLDEVLYS